MVAVPQDWQDFDNAALRKQADRLWALVSHDRAPKRIELLSVLDFLLGALHELIRADLYDFDFKPNQRPAPLHIRERSLALTEGRWRRDGKWMAGLHYNSALVRLAAVHDRSLKLVVGTAAAKKDRLDDFRRKATKFYVEHTGKPWTYSNIDRVYTEVNNLKHKQAGTWTGRQVPFETAMRGLRETLDLLEVWVRVKA